MTKDERLQRNAMVWLLWYTNKSLTHARLAELFGVSVTAIKFILAQAYTSLDRNATIKPFNSPPYYKRLAQANALHSQHDWSKPMKPIQFRMPCPYCGRYHETCRP